MDVCVVMFDIGVLCFLPKRAVNGDNFVVEFGIIFISLDDFCNFICECNF